jgi:hypothetical protein
MVSGSSRFALRKLASEWLRGAVVAVRSGSPRRGRANAAERDSHQVFDNTGNFETADAPALMIPET